MPACSLSEQISGGCWQKRRNTAWKIAEPDLIRNLNKPEYRIDVKRDNRRNFNHCKFLRQKQLCEFKAVCQRFSEFFFDAYVILQTYVSQIRINRTPEALP